ncbi:hypothetical protein KY290_031394 [Solanum tuberosum]|uniref:Glycosyltransferase n=1 Tax=Solanum tuberosum TaxID=4113 RepID=A0ABQ7UAN3_SOLTU|nr:hypothetical protein KY289_030783 [Solanum tuberosum]KAH0743401.1 hypothetical protein KY290_031394 [Solanum tuberosum]
MLSPYLNVANNLTDRGFLIYFCSALINLKSTINKIPEKYAELNFTYQNYPNFLLITIRLMQWAEHVANEPNIPVVKLLTSGAAVFSYFFNLLKKPEVEFPFPAIYLRKIEQVRLSERLSKSNKEKEPDDGDLLADGNMQIMLMSTSRTIQAKYIDYCTELSNLLENYWKSRKSSSLRRAYDTVLKDISPVKVLARNKDENSTVFVSFGSEYFLSKEDMEEVASGLELSNVNFIWVARFPKGEEQNIEDALPKGFLERIGERGRVLDKFAPQPRNLNYPSTGGFISHCGWNSTMETIDFRVPIVAIPMHLDQPMNARLIVELGVAVEIVRDDDGKIHRGEIAETLKRCHNRKTGGKLRAKVRDISKNLKYIRDEEMDTAAQELIQLYS